MEERGKKRSLFVGKKFNIFQNHKNLSNLEINFIKWGAKFPNEKISQKFKENKVILLLFFKVNLEILHF